MNLFSALKLLIFITAGLLAARLSVPVIRKLVKKIAGGFSEEVQKTTGALSLTPVGVLFLCGIWYGGLEWIGPEEQWRVFLTQPLYFLLGYSLISISFQLLDILEIPLVRFLSSEGDSLGRHIVTYLKRALKILIAVLAVLLLLQNYGLNVTSLLAGLGLGGVALALAAKETLGNLFGGVTVIFDRPFSIGDWIVCDGMEGTVEDIGVRSTKVKTFYDSVITIPNSAIANNIVDNLGRRKARRARFTLDLTYDTAPEALSAFVEGVKNILLSNSCTRKDYYQVYFNGFGPSSLQVFVNFFLKVKNWDEELSQKQKIFLDILRLSKKLNVSFAFPTQTVDIPSFPGQPDKPKHTLSPKELKMKAEEFAPPAGK